MHAVHVHLLRRPELHKARVVCIPLLKTMCYQPWDGFQLGCIVVSVQDACCWDSLPYLTLCYAGQGALHALTLLLCWQDWDLACLTK